MITDRTQLQLSDYSNRILDFLESNGLYWYTSDSGFHIRAERDSYTFCDGWSEDTNAAVQLALSALANPAAWLYWNEIPPRLQEIVDTVAPKIEPFIQEHCGCD